jgi:predicted RNA binding protein with dsRBD fold (UPF0201 family)
MNVNVAAEAAVEPTEDERKVERALLKMFPSGRIERISGHDDSVVLKVQGSGLEFLSHLRSLIKQERIRGAARTILIRSTRDHGMRIYLNKQAAFMDRVSFCEPVGESPHGPISVELESEELQAVIDFLARN